MQDFLELPKSPSLFVESCDVLSGKFNPDIDSLEAYTVQHTCDNPYRQNIITCKDSSKHLFLEEVEGLSLNLELSSYLDDLPYYIPVLDRNVSSTPSLSEIFPVVSVSLNDMLTSAVNNRRGVLREAKNIGFRMKLLEADCFKNKNVILFNTGPDTLIELIWRKRHQHNFFSKVKQMGFYAVGGFNFSLINGECPFGQALNIKRSLYSSFESEKFDNISIPHVYALTKYHVEKWVNWLTANPNIKYVTTNCQLQHCKDDVTQLAQAIKAILDKVPYLHIILQGFHFSNIREHFAGYMQRLHFADKHPLKQAQSHLKMTFNDSTNTFIKSYSPFELVSDLTSYNFYQRLVQLNSIRDKMNETKHLLKVPSKIKTQ